MAMYKIPQDVEADDKFLGPLSFKQFLFAGITAIALYLSFLSLTKGFWPALIIFLPIAIVGGFLGFPWGRDQPTEVWLAARIRFFLKPRVRIWNQAGMKELVTITAPKKIEKHYSDGLSQTEVKSRLNGLATLLDSRGWAVKNAGQSNGYSIGSDQNGDRLLDVGSVQQTASVEAMGIDVLDEKVSNTAIHFEEMIKNSEQKHRQEIMQHLSDVRVEPAVPQPVQAPAADFSYLQQGMAQGGQPTTPLWFTSTAPTQATQQPVPDLGTFQSTNLVAPGATAYTAPDPTPAVSPADEAALLAKIHSEQQNAVQQYSHLKTIQPIGQAPVQTTPPQQPQTEVTTPVDPAIINLANNDDLSVETVAHEANKRAGQNLSDDEVVISLR